MCLYDIMATPMVHAMTVRITRASQVKINDALLPTLAPPNRTTVFGVNLTQPLVKPTGTRFSLHLPACRKHTLGGSQPE